MIPRWRYILPTILAIVTGSHRECMVAGVDFEWSSNNWTHNFFRVLELIFWRKEGIRREARSLYTRDENGYLLYKREFFTLEARVAHIEGYVRLLLRSLLSGRAVIMPSGFRLVPQLGAIATDTFGTNTAYSTTATHTCSGANRLFLVGLDCDDASNLYTSSTYDTVACSTTVTQAGDSANHNAHLISLVGPNTTTNASYAITGGANYYIAMGSYTGVSQSGYPDASGGNLSSAGISSPYTVALTTVADNCWRYWHVRGSAAQTAGTNSTQRTAQFTTIKEYDSGGPITPAGSFSMSVTFTGTDTLWSTTASFAPAGGAAASTRDARNLILLGVG